MRVFGIVLFYLGIGITISYLTVAIGGVCKASTPTRWSYANANSSKRPVTPRRSAWLRSPPIIALAIDDVRVGKCVGFERRLYSEIKNAGSQYNSDVYLQSRDIAGWPFSTTEYRTDLMRPETSHRMGWLRWNQDSFSFVLKVPRGNSATLDLPLRPRFPGALLNSAFWGGLVFLAVQLIRRLRRRPGACPACGYQVNDLPLCPECGSRPLPT